MSDEFLLNSVIFSMLPIIMDDSEDAPSPPRPIGPIIDPMPYVPFPTSPAIRDLLAAELATDLGAGDISTQVFPNFQSDKCAAVLVAKANGIVAGLEAFPLVWELLGEGVKSEPLIASGSEVAAGQPVARYSGTVATLLAGERTALNLVGHLSGIATLTARYVQEVAGTGCKITDTRKTLPGLRSLQKYAVRCGGGVNHRFGLHGAVMLKDNHLTRLGNIHDALAAIRQQLGPTTRIEVEVTTYEQFQETVAAGPDVILLDNMDLSTMQRCCSDDRKGILLEASGGMTLERVAEVARLGVDFVSVGRLTHSAPALDLSLEFQSP